MPGKLGKLMGGGLKRSLMRAWKILLRSRKERQTRATLELHG